MQCAVGITCGGDMQSRKLLVPTWYGGARREWVTVISGAASADRGVVDDVAEGIGSARARTRVYTLLVEASPVGAALRVDGALWPAVGGRSDEVGQAGAGWALPSLLALGVRPTGGRLARVNGIRWLGRNWKWKFTVGITY